MSNPTGINQYSKGGSSKSKTIKGTGIFKGINSRNGKLYSVKAKTGYEPKGVTWKTIK